MHDVGRKLADDGVVELIDKKYAFWEFLSSPGAGAQGVATSMHSSVDNEGLQTGPNNQSYVEVIDLTADDSFPIISNYPSLEAGTCSLKSSMKSGTHVTACVESDPGKACDFVRNICTDGSEMKSSTSYVASTSKSSPELTSIMAPPRHSLGRKKRSVPSFSMWFGHRKRRCALPESVDSVLETSEDGDLPPVPSPPQATAPLPEPHDREMPFAGGNKKRTASRHQHTWCNMGSNKSDAGSLHESELSDRNCGKIKECGARANDCTAPVNGWKGNFESSARDFPSYIESTMYADLPSRNEDNGSKNLSASPEASMRQGRGRALTSRFGSISSPRLRSNRRNILGVSKTLQLEAAPLSVVRRLKSTDVEVAKAALQQKPRQFFTAWNDFQRKNWGKGWSRDEMRKKYKVPRSILFFSRRFFISLKLCSSSVYTLIAVHAVVVASIYRHLEHIYVSLDLKTLCSCHHRKLPNPDNKALQAPVVSPSAGATS